MVYLLPAGARAKELQFEFKRAEKAADTAKISKEAKTTIKLRSEDMARFRQSLTQQQRELHKKQGYLKVSDLTAEQRNILGVTEDASISIHLASESEDIRIQSR